MSIDQIGIAVFGSIAILFTQMKGWERYACIIGLLSQPFYIFSFLAASQPGALFVSLLCTLFWLTGFWRFWIFKTTDDQLTQLIDLAERLKCSYSIRYKGNKETLMVFKND